MPRLPASVQTNRLLLRLWTVDDIPAMSRAITESLDHLTPWMAWAAEEPLAPELRREFIETGRAQWEAGGDAAYGVFLDDLPIGGAGLHRRGGPEMLEIGYWLHVDHTGRGYATELSAALTTAAFAEPGIERVEIHHEADNEASAAVPRRLGYTRTSAARDRRASDGLIVWTWAMPRHQWPERAEHS